jgi:hypothetical protein
LTGVVYGHADINITQTISDVVFSDLPKGGHWRICYCASLNGCDHFSEFLSDAGLLTVRGADGATSRDVCVYRRVARSLLTGCF